MDLITIGAPLLSSAIALFSAGVAWKSQQVSATSKVLIKVRCVNVRWESYDGDITWFLENVGQLPAKNVRIHVLAGGEIGVHKELEEETIDIYPNVRFGLGLHPTARIVKVSWTSPHNPLLRQSVKIPSYAGDLEYQIAVNRMPAPEQ